MAANINWKLHLENAALPLGMFATLVVMELLWQPLGLPPIETIVAYLKLMFATYGLWALFVCAFIEGIFVVSFYLPGSLVIFSAILLSNRTVPELLTIFAICWVSFTLAAVVNYGIGYHGLYRVFNALGAKTLIRSTQGWMLKYGKLTYALSAFHPNYISVVEVCSGIARQGLLKTLAYAGAAMAFTGPILVFGSAMIIDTVTTDNGMSKAFLVFIAIFAAWALAVLAKGIYTDIRTSQNSYNPTTL